MITRLEILHFLQSNKELFTRKFNINKIGIFGSFAREEQCDSSDIDIIVQFEKDTPCLFEKRMELKKMIQSHFHKEVDICHEPAIKPVFRNLILSETIYAFQ